MTSDADDKIAAIPVQLVLHVETHVSPLAMQSTSSGSSASTSSPHVLADQRVAALDHTISGLPSSQPSILRSQTESDDIPTRPGPLRRHSEFQPAHTSFLSPSGANIHLNESSLSLERGVNRIDLPPISTPLQNFNFSKLKLTWIHVPFNNPTWVPVSFDSRVNTVHQP